MHLKSQPVTTSSSDAARQLRGGEALEARPTAARPDARRGDVLTRAQPVDRRRPHGRGGRPREGADLVARESATTYEAAIDQLLDKLERQVERYRDKRTVENAPARTADQRSGAERRIELPRDESAA